MTTAAWAVLAAGVGVLVASAALVVAWTARREARAGAAAVLAGADDGRCVHDAAGSHDLTTHRPGVVWHTRFDPGAAQWILTNDGANPAHNVRISLRGPVHLERHVDGIGPGEVETVPLSEDIVASRQWLERQDPSSRRFAGPVDVRGRASWEDGDGALHLVELPRVKLPGMY
jgi:hypothetical protein